MPELPPQLFAALAFLSVSIPLYLLFARLCGRHRNVLQRIDQLSVRITESRAQSNRPLHGIKRFLTAQVSRIASRLLPVEEHKRTRLQERMLHAGLYNRSAIHLFVTVRLLLMVLPVPLTVVARASGMIGHSLALLCAAIACCAAMLLPGFWLDCRKSRRQLVLGRSLPDFLDLLVTCLESGLSLDAALRRVTSELRFAHPLLAVEMDRVHAEIDLGANPGAALRSLAERTDLESVHTLATFVHQARMYGTSISDALRAHSEMLREQREQRAEEKAQKATVKILFPTLLCIFPAIFVVLAGPAAIQLNENLVNHQENNQTQRTDRR